MANTTISVNKQTVLQLLTSGQDIPFVIPEYQRPYSWGDDEINTLFDDLWNFSIERSQSKAKNYFLGCVVAYNENDERQIIDGQQRITSLFLLLRAIFSMLEKDENKNDDKVSHFISQIKPALWKRDEMTGKEDRSKMLLRSEVVSDSGNELLRKILETGETASDATDNYSNNYNTFIKLYKEKAVFNSLQIFDFILSILNYTIILPIDADDQETALTIFNTLNNRGLPLSDSDIFKSYLYKQLSGNDTEKKNFIQKWKDLESEVEKANESIQSLFYYHMFYLRAQEKDEKTTTPGARKYYLEKKKNRLTPGIIDQLAENLHLWEVVNCRQSIEGEAWSQNMDIRKILDCLSSYTNEFWKYPVSIFYMQYKKREDFEDLFLKFLRKFYVLLLTRFLERPTISAVKADILKLDVQIINSCHPNFTAGFDEKKLDDDLAIRAEKKRTDELIIKPHPKVERMLLKLLAYDESAQNDLLPAYWEIEHIFPQTWDTKYYSINKETANEMLEHLGNKLPLEKKLNISASNHYFDKKKERYQKSQIAISKKIGESSVSDWDIDSVTTNDADVCARIKEIFQNWVDDYEPVTVPQTNAPVPTEEDLEMMRKLREKGLIP